MGIEINREVDDKFKKSLSVSTGSKKPKEQNAMPAVSEGKATSNHREINTDKHKLKRQK